MLSWATCWNSGCQLRYDRYYWPCDNIWNHYRKYCGHAAGLCRSTERQCYSNNNNDWIETPGSRYAMTKKFAVIAALFMISGLVLGQTFSVGKYMIIGGNTLRSDADRWNDKGINILEFGADPTGVNDSTAAVQAALDYAMLHKPNRDVVCPDGTYKISLPIFIDPPGSLRGADGTNGTPYNVASGYSIGNTINYLGVPYVSLTNGNGGNTPSTSPTQWQPLNWNSATTYSTGNLVRYQGVIWKSTQNSN